MTSSRVATPGALLVIFALGVAPLSAQSPTDLTGSWTLNRQLSQFPKEVGFSASLLPAGPGATGGGGRSSRIQSQTEDDVRRVRFLTDEVRLPPDQLTIAVTPATVTITPDRGAARTVQPGKRDEELKLGPVMVLSNALWDRSNLAIVFKAENGRLLRYTYSTTLNPRQLIVDVEFMERGGDQVRRVYEPTPPGEAAAAPSISALGPPPASAAPRLPPPGATGVGGSPPSSPAAAAAVDQRPDASLKGLTRLGVVLEGLDAAAGKCGLQQAALEAAIAKRLTDAGFRLVRDTDDATYLYVHINTVTASAALCVSRYDVTLYSNATAQLTHTASPVPVQVELWHKGGLAGGGPAAHADGVLKSVLEYVDELATRVRNATR